VNSLGSSRFLVVSLSALSRLFIYASAAFICSCGASAAVAGAASAGSGWELHLSSQPTYVSPVTGGTVALLATDRGAASTAEGTAIVISVTLPTRLEPSHPSVELKPNGIEPHSCEVLPVVGAGSTVRCVFTGVLPGNNAEGLVVLIPVSVAAGKGELGSEPEALPVSASVVGGGAPPATVATPIDVSAGIPPFGPQSFAIGTTGVDGWPDLQAGSHPNLFSTYLEFNNDLNLISHQAIRPVEPVDLVTTDLPLGLIADPRAAPTCSTAKLFEENSPHCPLGSIVGTIAFSNEAAGGYNFSGDGDTSPLYNRTPERGYAAEFSFTFLAHAGTIFGSLAHTPEGYVLRATVSGIPYIAGFKGALLTFFGNPGAADGLGSNSPAFFTNPVSCGAGGVAHLAMTSWALPGSEPAELPAAFPAMTGCDRLHFEPRLSVVPETTQRDTPSGFTVGLRVPQDEAPSGLASADLKDAVIRFPQGVSLSPGAANGLGTCPAGPEGIGFFQTEVGERGQEHLAPGHCPASSQIGKVKIVTPLLSQPLEGHLFLAAPKCGGEGQNACTEASATNGELFRVYLEAEGTGQVLKLEGTVAANPSTGQVSVTFDDAPEMPFGELTVTVNGGPLGSLATPQGCGSFATTSDLTPWSTPETPDATPESNPFTIAGCPGAIPFTPGFSAGMTSAVAGAHSPFVLSFSRRDGEQDLGGIEQTLPPGLLANIAGVMQCGETQANAGSCPASSEIGTVSVDAGAGIDPYYVQGKVYLTGPYNGGPFGISVAVPAVAGPFNLGMVVVRGSIRINPNTAQATVVSNAFPSILDGVPLRVKTVDVALKESFTFNPTNCTKSAVTGEISSTQGASAAVSSPFAVNGCRGLLFKPSFTLSTQARTSKARGASLTVKVVPAAGQANIAKVVLQLPKQLPSRLSTLQKACTEAQFNANPAGCPAASDIGSAKALSPILSSPLEGPAYLVSHGGAAFPDVVFVLQGEGVTIDLGGKTQIKNGVTYSRFETVPDAPIGSFETVLPEGPDSVLGTNIPEKAKGSLCGLKLSSPTTITGQNGAVVKQTTKLNIIGCPRTVRHAHKRRRRK
jgi:hypothetical protein